MSGLDESISSSVSSSSQHSKQLKGESSKGIIKIDQVSEQSEFSTENNFKPIKVNFKRQSTIREELFHVVKPMHNYCEGVNSANIEPEFMRFKDKGT